MYNIFPYILISRQSSPTISEEHRDAGSVGVLTYLRYFWSGGGILGVFLFFTLNIGAQTCYIATDWWLSYWTEQTTQQSKVLSEYHNSTAFNITSPPPDSALMDYYVYIYSGLVVSVFIVGFLRAIMMFQLMVRCSQQLHLAMFHAVIRSPILFFDTNPIGTFSHRFIIAYITRGIFIFLLI